MTSKQIDINCDLGESPERYHDGTDSALLALVSSVNIACGFHAGDHNLMAALVNEAGARGVGVGAHPGLPDREGFGRYAMPLSPEEIANAVAYQVGALHGIARRLGVSLRHVKPHGALYWMAEADDAVAQAITSAVHAIDAGLILVGFAGGRLVRVGAELGLLVANEAFADRTYQPDGTLTPRTEPNALIDDPMQSTRRMVRLIGEGLIQATDGSDLSVHTDTICIHGDGPVALAHANGLRAAMIAANVAIRPLGAA